MKFPPNARMTEHNQSTFIQILYYCAIFKKIASRNSRQLTEPQNKPGAPLPISPFLLSILPPLPGAQHCPP